MSRTRIRSDSLASGDTRDNEGSAWEDPSTIREGKTFWRICADLPGVDVFRAKTWGELGRGWPRVWVRP